MPPIITFIDKFDTFKFPKVKNLVAKEINIISQKYDPVLIGTLPAGTTYTPHIPFVVGQDFKWPTGVPTLGGSGSVTLPGGSGITNPGGVTGGTGGTGTAVIPPVTGGTGGTGTVVTPPVTGGTGGTGTVVIPPVTGGTGGTGTVVIPPVTGGTGGTGTIVIPPITGGTGGTAIVTPPPSGGTTGAGITEGAPVITLPGGGTGGVPVIRFDSPTLGLLADNLVRTSGMIRSIAAKENPTSEDKKAIKILSSDFDNTAHTIVEMVGDRKDDIDLLGDDSKALEVVRLESASIADHVKMTKTKRKAKTIMSKHGKNMILKSMMGKLS